jgi:hypothetical protein
MHFSTVISALGIVTFGACGRRCIPPFLKVSLISASSMNKWRIAYFGTSSLQDARVSAVKKENQAQTYKHPCWTHSGGAVATTGRLL